MSKINISDILFKVNKILSNYISKYIPAECVKIECYKIEKFNVRISQDFRFSKEEWNIFRLENENCTYLYDTIFVSNIIKQTLFEELHRICEFSEITSSINLACDRINQGCEEYFIQDFYITFDFHLLFLVIDKNKYYKFMKNQYFTESPFSTKHFPYIDILLKLVFKNICDVFKYPSKINNIDFKSKELEFEAINILLKKFNLPNQGLLLTLSALRYETVANTAKLAFIENINLISGDFILFKEPIPLHTDFSRELRKYMEMATNGYYIAVINNQLCGLFSEITNDFPIIQFKGYLNWELNYSNCGIVEYKDGSYVLPVKNDFIEIFDFFPEIEKNKIVHCILKAQQQKHGTTIILLEYAKEEAERLCSFKRGIAIECVDLYKHLNLIKQITSIDGAIILDFDCKCYAIGVILDGPAVIEGTSSRGARYNSAKNYIAIQAKSNKKGVAIIISEDKTIDLLDTNDMCFKNNT